MSVSLFREISAFNTIFAGNEDIITLDSVISTDEYSNDVVLTTITGKKPGYTTLRLKYLRGGEEYTEMRPVVVMSEDIYLYDYDDEGNPQWETEWDAPVDWTTKSELVPYAKNKTNEITVRYVEGRPVYETLDTEGRITLGFLGNSDTSYSDAEGIVGSYWGNLYNLKYDGEGKFSLTDRYGNYYPTIVEWEARNLWIEVPGYPELNGLVSVSEDMFNFIEDRDDLLNGDFVPYAELVREGHRVKKVKWSFINPKTKATVSPSVENLRIYSNYYGYIDKVTGASGEFEVDNYDYNNMRIYIYYDLGGITYSWSFEPMREGYSNYWDNESQSWVYGYFVSDAGRLTEEPLILSVDETIDVSLSLDIALLEDLGITSVSIAVGSSDIVSVSPVTLNVSTASQVIKITGKSEGQTTISIVFANYYDYYASGPYLIQVGSVDVAPGSTPEPYPTPEPPASGSLHLEQEYPLYSYVMLAEGKPYYRSYYYNDTSLMFRLRGEDATVTISADLWNDDETREQMLRGVISYTDTYGETYSQDVWLNSMWGYEDDATITRENLYCDIYISPASGTVVKWDFQSLDIHGSETVSYGTVRSSLEQYNTYMPSVELIRDGLNVTGIKWGFVNSKDEAVPDPDVTNVNLRYMYDDHDVNKPSGSITFDAPIPFVDFGGVSFYFTEGGINYAWDFRNWQDSGAEWEFTYPDYPVVIKAGSSKEVNVLLRAYYAEDIKAYTGSDILSIDIINIAENAETRKETRYYWDGDDVRHEESYDVYYYRITLKLTAKASGVTTFSLATEGWMWVSPNEVWIYGTDNKVAGLSTTATVNELLAVIERGYTTSDGIYTEPERPSGTRRYTADEDIFIENLPPVTFTGRNTTLNGLSVKPRFAVPQDPDEGAYISMWDYVGTLGLDDVLVFEDEDFTEARDAEEVFDAVKSALISQETHQILAVVLPAVSVDEPGYYTFSIAVDNIPDGTNIFLYSQNISSDDKYVFMEADGTLTSVVNGETIDVSAYLEAGEYAPIITAEATANDIALIGANTSTLQITTTSLQDGTVGIAYRATLTANESPVTWSVPANTLPRGLSLDASTGIIAGTPEVSGDFAFTVTAQGRYSVSRDLAIMINPASSGETVSVLPEETKLDVEAVADYVLGKLDIGGNVSVEKLPATSYGDTRKMTSEQTARIPSGQKAAAVLPIITVEKPAVYIFAVTLTLAPGTPIFLHMMPEPVNAGMFSSSADDDVCMFLDDRGNEIHSVPGSQQVNIAAYMTPEYMYAPVITTEATQSTGTGPGDSSSGGCNEGFSVYALALAVGVLLRRK